MFATLTNAEALVCTGRLHRNLPKSTKNIESSVFYLHLRQVYSALQTAVRECLLSIGAESFVFQFAIQKYKYQHIRCQLFKYPGA